MAEKNFYAWLSRLRRPRVYTLLFNLWSDSLALAGFLRHVPYVVRHWRGESRFYTGALVAYYRGEAPEHFARKCCEVWGVPATSEQYSHYVELARAHVAGHLGPER